MWRPTTGRAVRLWPDRMASWNTHAPEVSSASVGAPTEARIPASYTSRRTEVAEWPLCALSWGGGGSVCRPSGALSAPPPPCERGRRPSGQQRTLNAMAVCYSDRRLRQCHGRTVSSDHVCALSCAPVVWGLVLASASDSSPGGGGGSIRTGGGGGSGTQKKAAYQKWPGQIFPRVHFVLSHDGHWSLWSGGGGGGGVQGSLPLLLRRRAILTLPWGRGGG